MRDHRTKISVRADQVLAGLAHARGCDKQDISRETGISVDALLSDVRAA